MVRWWFFELIVLLAGMFKDTSQLGASVIMMTISYLMHTFSMGVGMSTTILVGN